MIPIKHIKIERCECGGIPVREEINGFNAEERKFSCGRLVVLRGGNTTNFYVEDFTKCPNSDEGKAKKAAIASLLSELQATCDQYNHDVDDVVLADVKSSINNSLSWRLR